MVTFTQQLIAAAGTHQLVAVFLEAGGRIRCPCGHRNHDAKQGELRDAKERIPGGQSRGYQS